MKKRATTRRKKVVIEPEAPPAAASIAEGARIPLNAISTAHSAVPSIQQITEILPVIPTPSAMEEAPPKKQRKPRTAAAAAATSAAAKTVRKRRVKLDADDEAVAVSSVRIPKTTVTNAAAAAPIPVPVPPPPPPQAPQTIVAPIPPSQTPLMTAEPIKIRKKKKVIIKLPTPPVPATAAAAAAEKKPRAPRKRKIVLETPAEIPMQSPTPVREKKVIRTPSAMESAAPAPTKKTVIPKESVAQKKEFTDLEFEKQEYDENAAAAAAAAEYDFLYPHLNDPNFNQKIAQKKEFADFKYDGTIHNIKTYSDVLCSAPFELSPHQMFVKNFLSFQTPYNSLLLYHGLGTGKTCSAIGITEEMRDYMRQTGLTQKIIIVASPNVQGNFRKELFNEARLQERDGIWTLNTCIGSKLLKEINPTNIRGIPREKIVSQINTIINTYYEFMGYIEFSHYIEHKIKLVGEFSLKEKQKYEIQQLRKHFNNRLIVIDEVHNITMEKDIRLGNPGTAAATQKEAAAAAPLKSESLSINMLKLARYCDNMRLLLLSATPMYNKYSEIIWLTNLMNLNDKRPLIKTSDVFTQSGDFVVAGGRHIENGRDLLMRKLTGYVSYVRGENPYTFPFRIYPRDFAAAATNYYDAAAGLPYPKIQMNGAEITEPLKYIEVYSTPIGEIQEKGYMKIVSQLRRKVGDEFDFDEFQEKENFGYSKLIQPLEALNMVYPLDDNDDDEGGDGDFDKTVNFTGKRGLQKINMYHGASAATDFVFDYKPAILEKHGRIFSRDHIHKYSHKIADICENIRRGAEGIIIIYSFNIDGGLVPMALALEEMGFARFSSATGSRSLFAKPPTEAVDATTMKSYSEFPSTADGAEGAPAFSPAKYVMITGDKRFSKNNSEDLKYVVSPENKMGEKIKVVLISLSGSEGLDFKCVRQIHIMDPWYNMSRVEQIIGRGVRNLSHCSLPFEKRNVEIYLHTTRLLSSAAAAAEEEAVDLYLYRFAEKKAIQIGRVSRLIKELAADCLLNIGQTNFTIDRMNQMAENQKVVIQTSSGKTLDFKVGDRPNTAICDYMDTCEYACIGAAAAATEAEDTRTYDEIFMDRNRDQIMKRIRQLYKEQSMYKRADLIAQINVVKKYPIDQIFSALSAFINNENEYLVDRMGRYGSMINRGEYYIFQPADFTDRGATLYERNIPVDSKRDKLRLEVPATISAAVVDDQSRAVDSTISVPPPPPPKTSFLDRFRENMRTFDAAAVPVGEKTWYKYAKDVARYMPMHGVPLESVRKYVIYHMVDTYPDKLELVKWSEARRAAAAAAEGAAAAAADDLENQIHEYLQKKRMEAGDYASYLIDEGDEWRIYVVDGAEFEVASEDEKKVLFPELRRFLFPINQYSSIVGFINPFKEREHVFKIKHMSQKRNNKGVACASSSGKSEIIKDINTILGITAYTDENTVGVTKPIFCCLVEFLLRHNRETRRDGKVWFFTPEEAAINQVKDK